MNRPPTLVNTASSKLLVVDRASRELHLAFPDWHVTEWTRPLMARRFDLIVIAVGETSVSQHELMAEFWTKLKPGGQMINTRMANTNARKTDA